MLTLANKIQSEGDAYRLLEEMRWKGTPVCPHCQSTKAYFLKSDLGEVRKTRTGNKTERRLWKCGSCRKQYSVLTGTIFHGTKISIRTWLFVLFEMASNKNGLAAREIERKYNLTPKSAWFMTQRIREAMKRDPLVGVLKGNIVSDETFIGGKAKNKHRQGYKVYAPDARRKAIKDTKVPVVSLIDRETGEVRSQVVPDVTGKTLRRVIAEQVDVAHSHLVTDSAGPYTELGASFQSHETVNHYKYEYVRGDVTTNQAEGYFSQLKRSLDGTHHHISKEHLHRYLAEFDFRYSTCKLNDTVRMQQIVSQVSGRRLTYKPLKMNSEE